MLIARALGAAPEKISSTTTNALRPIQGGGSASSALRAVPSPPHLSDVIARVLSSTIRRLDARREELNQQLAFLPKPATGPTSESSGYHSTMAGSATTAKWVQVDLGQTVAIDGIALVPTHVIFGSHPGPGYGFPERFRVDISDDPQFGRRETVADHTGADFANPGDAPYLIRTPGQAGRYVRVTATKLWKRGNHWIFSLGELIVLSGKKNASVSKPVSALDSIENSPLWGNENLVDSQSILGLPIEAEESRSNGYHSREFEKHPDTVKWVQVDLRQSVPIDEVRLIPAHPLNFADIFGFGFPVRFRVEISDDPAFGEAQIVADKTADDFHNPGDNLVVFPASGTPARYVRVTATRLWERTKDYAFALAELQVASGDKNVALGAEVTALDSVEYAGWSTKYLVDGFASQNRLAEFSTWLEGLARRHEIQRQLQQLETERTQSVTGLVATATRSLGLTLAGLMAAAFFAAYRYRMARLLEMERLRNQIATDLHDELGAGLTQIALVSELAKRNSGNMNEVERHAVKISEKAREMVHTLDEIVWAVNPKNDSLKKLVGYILQHAEKFFEDTPIRCRMDAPPVMNDQTLSAGMRHNIFLAVKEALNNVVKHAEATEVWLRLAIERSSLRIAIEDNGRGFDPDSDCRLGNGLANIQRRVTDVGGCLELVSQPGHGTRILIAVNLPRVEK